MNDQINKIKNISEYIKSKNLDVKIEIDGGINYETGKNLRRSWGKHLSSWLIFIQTRRSY